MCNSYPLFSIVRDHVLLYNGLHSLVMHNDYLNLVLFQAKEA